MRIDRIEKSKHKQERVLVFLEGGDLLRITGAELLRFGLYKGMDLPPALVVELQAAAQKSELKQTAARMASGQMLSKKEVQRRLIKKGADQQEAEETADWLESLGAVDDAGYAGVIVRHYGAMGYGAGRVRQELHRRGRAEGAVGRGAGAAAAAGGGHTEISGGEAAGTRHDPGGQPPAGRRPAAAGLCLAGDTPCAQRVGAGDRGDVRYTT